MTQLILTIVAAVLLLPGLLGIIVPVVPGIPYMLAIAGIFAWLTKFSVLTGWELGWLAGLTIVAIGIDYLSGVLGAKFGGASGKSLLVGMVGFVLGTILLPPLGGLLGMFVGIVAGEIYFLGRTQSAVKAASGGVLGTLAGMVINFLIGLTFIGLFLVFVS